MSRRDAEILDATHIHDHCVVALKGCPKYEHDARDVDKVLRFLRRQDIHPLDVDIKDSLKGLLDPEKAERLRVHAPIRKWKKRTLKEIAKIWDLPVSFIVIVELERQKKYGAVLFRRVLFSSMR
jgi:hypothetical protein